MAPGSTMGDLKLAAFLAYTTIFKGNRWALVLIVTVMALSFANLLLTPSILFGVTDTVNRQQVDALYGDIVVDPPSDRYYLSHANDITQSIAQLPGVTGVAPRLNGSGLIEYDWQSKDSVFDRGTSGTWPVLGIDPDLEANVTTIPDSVIAGTHLEKGDRDSVLLGVDIAGGEHAGTAEFETLGGIVPGERVRITYANGIQRKYTVKGIVYARESRADRTAYVTLDEMVSVLGRTVYSSRASQILVAVDESVDGAAVITAIRSFDFPAEVRSWREYGGAWAGIISSFNVVAGLISGIGLVVAGIVMFIVIYINVIHSRRHIGILRAIGIKRDVIFGSYLIQALFYAAAGIVLGGLAFKFGVQTYFDYHPLDLSMGLVKLALQPETVSSAVIGLIAAAILAGLIPVFSITRQGIIRAIWGN